MVTLDNMDLGYCTSILCVFMLFAKILCALPCCGAFKYNIVPHREGLDPEVFQDIQGQQA